MHQCMTGFHPDKACLTLRGIHVAVLAVHVVVVDVRKIAADLLHCTTWNSMNGLPCCADPIKEGRVAHLCPGPQSVPASWS